MLCMITAPDQQKAPFFFSQAAYDLLTNAYRIMDGAAVDMYINKHNH